MMKQSPDTSVVYIVEEEESVRRAISLLMRSAGVSFCAFGSAEQFLAEVDPKQRGCVLLDTTSPRLTGVQLRKELQHRHINLPVIAMSARDDAETSTLARQMGARLLFRKPVDDQALLDAIRWVLETDPSPAPKVQ